MVYRSDERRADPDDREVAEGHSDCIFKRRPGLVRLAGANLVYRENDLANVGLTLV